MIGEWVKEHQAMVAGASIGLLVVSVAVGFAIAIWMPADFLVREKKPGEPKHVVRLIVQNIAGGLLVLLGVVMSLPLVPGPGVLLILVGLSVMSFPGKRKLEHTLVGNRYVLGPINRLRGWVNQPAIEKSGGGPPGSA